MNGVTKLMRVTAITLFCALIMLTLLTISFSNHIEHSPHYLEGENKEVHQALSQISNPAVAVIALQLDEQKLMRLSSILSSQYPKTQIQLQITNAALKTASQFEFSVGRYTLFFKISCTIKNALKGTEVTVCKLGKIPVFGAVAEIVFSKLLNNLFGDNSSSLTTSLLSGSRIAGRSLLVFAHKPIEFLAQTSRNNSSPINPLNTFSSWRFVEPKSVNTYLSAFSVYQGTNISLAELIFMGFELARTSPNNLPPEKENEALLWALALSSGTQEFARFLARPDALIQLQPINATLSQRRDLAQHFIYSAALYLVGSEELANIVGEAKEIFDSQPNGSGFSFADLAADKAGVKFAEYATSNNKTAIAVQCILTGERKESHFFPNITELPEGISETDFKQTFSSVNSTQYKQLVSIIETRLNYVPVFRDSLIEICA